MLLSDLGEDGCSGDIYTNYICDRIRTAELNEDGSCTETVLLGPEDGDCGGLLGSDHKVTWEYSQPINDCEYKLDPSFEWPQTANLQGFEAIEYKSRTGNKKEKSTTTYKKIIHQPTATCYLKVWMRALIQDYTIAPRTSESSGPCDGPFNKVGEKYEGAVYTYEWEGSGRPCYQNDSKPHFDTDNLIEGDIDWHFETEDVLIASGKSMEVEIKYSFIKGYEPLWPSERGPNDCKNDGFPKC